MSERFTDGNLIVIYAIHTSAGAREGGENESKNALPDYVRERVMLALKIYEIIMKSKPDRHRTGFIISGGGPASDEIKRVLVKSGIDENIITIDKQSQSISQTMEMVTEIISERPNPPFIYFVCSYWMKEIYDSIVLSRLRGFKVQFEGAPDHRPFEEIADEKALNRPRKGVEFFKRKAKDRAIDMLLNYIFPEDKSKKKVVDPN